MIVSDWEIMYDLVDLNTFTQAWDTSAFRQQLLGLYVRLGKNTHFSNAWISERMQLLEETTSLKGEGGTSHTDVKDFISYLKKHDKKGKSDESTRFSLGYGFLFMKALAGASGLFLSFKSTAFLTKGNSKKKEVSRELMQHRARLDLCQEKNTREKLNKAGRFKRYCKKITGQELQIPKHLQLTLCRDILKKKIASNDNKLRQKKPVDEFLPDFDEKLEIEFFDHLSIYGMEAALLVMQCFFNLSKGVVTLDNLDEHLRMLCLHAKMGMSLYDPLDNRELFLRKSADPVGKMKETLDAIPEDCPKSLYWGLGSHWGFAEDEIN